MLNKTLSACHIAGRVFASLIVFCALPAGVAAACGQPAWVDARCRGAIGDDAADDSAALAAAVHAALVSNRPLMLPAGTYRLSRALVIDYAARARTGLRLIALGAVLDGRGIAAGPVLRIDCSGGTAAAPKGCFYLHQEGTLFVEADTDSYAVVIGKPDFSDAQNSIRLDHLVVNNAGTGPAAGGLQLNYVLDADIFAVADSAGGGAGIALEQTQFSHLSGAGSARAGTGLLIENGYSFANTIAAIDLEAAPVCLTLASPQAAHNTFVSPYFACPAAVAATAGTATVLINPLFAGNVVTDFDGTSGVTVLPQSF
ncbi:MAG: hypothetical protein ACREE4_18865 [Stellaceae bacterium]